MQKVYEKDDITLFQGNCIEILNQANPESVDMIFADPPYMLSNGGITCQSGKVVSVNKGKWDKSKGIDEDFEFHQKWINACKRVLKPNGTIWISGTYHSIYICGFILQKAGFKILNDICWFKPSASPNMCCRYFTASHETLLWARKDPNGKHTFNYETMKNGDWDEDFIKKPEKQMRSVWAIGTPKSYEKVFGKHPTQKPLELLRRIILASTNIGDLILDPFTGSSTTGIMALELGREFIGIDLEKEYLDISIKRFEQVFSKKDKSMAVVLADCEQRAKRSVDPFNASNQEAKLKEETYPIVKWVGGKRQLMFELLKNMPKIYNRYYEPFIGGGALFFELQPQNAYISDTNEELINLYAVIRNNVDELIVDLQKHKFKKEYFMDIRNIDRAEEYKKWTNIQKASRFIYLNRTCFNGLYRVNSQGQFNVPFGNYKNPRIIDEQNLYNCSKLLQNTEIKCADFSAILDKIQKGDFVYFDPPYVPLNETSSFTSYTKDGFDIDMQLGLREVCDELDSMGVMFMLSNSDTKLVNELYSNYEIKKVFASRAVNADANGRGKITEVLVRNYD